jgi:hypothetical protein
MNWLGKLLNGVAGARPIEFTFEPSIEAADIPGIEETIEPDSCYIELYLESLRLEKARRFGTRFHGVVYSFVTLSREGEPRAELTAVSKPEKLAELDSQSIDRTITVSKQLMAATAFRGGPVSLELGLFSVKSGNLLTPILNYITKVSSAAGISYVGAIKPFVPLITEGMDLIAGQVQDTALEVGVDTDLTLTKSSAVAIIARPKGTVKGKLSLDRDRRLLVDGKQVDFGYVAFSIRRSLTKPDYGEIPELKERYAAIQTALKANRQKDARDALTAFRLATVASPDLIPSDARKLVEKATAKVTEAFPPGGFAAVETARPGEESLSAIGLYD